MVKKAKDRAGKSSPATDQENRLGGLPDDAAWVGRILKRLGWSESRLAAEAELSQKMVNYFLRGERRLSPKASSRVMVVLIEAMEKNRAEDEAWQKASLEVDPKDPLYNLKMLAALPPPETLVDKWKDAEIQRLTAEVKAFRELHSLSAEIISSQKESIASRDKVISDFKEMKTLFEGWMEHLRQQLLAAGITPEDFYPPE